LLNKSLDISASSDWLNNGKILIHPTEAVWGIGCDAFNKNSFLRVHELKKRPINKNFILLAGSYESVKYYLKDIKDSDINFLNTVWPGHVTVLFKYNKNLPEHLTNSTGKIAIRVSNHYPLKTIFKRFNGLMVSTSANISGENPINNFDQIIDTFGDKDVAYYDALLGDNKSPSKIIDLESRNIIRN